MYRKSLLTLSILSFVLVAQAQVVDEVRLGYDMSQVKAKQISVAASADGKLLAFAYSDGLVKIFDLESQRFKQEVQTSFKEVHDMKISNDEKIILTATKEIKVYNWKSGKELKSFALAARAIRMDFNAEHNIYVVGQMGGTISSFDMANLSLLYTNKFKGFMINAMALHPDGKYLAASFFSATSKYPVSILDIRTGEIVKTLEKEKYQTLNYSKEGELLAYGWGTAGEFWYKVLDTNYAETKSFTWPMQTYGYVEGVFSGNKAIYTTASLTIDVYDIDEKKLMYTSMADKSLMKILGGYAWPKIIKLTDTKFLFSYSNYNISRIYDAVSNNVVAYIYTDGGHEFCVVSKDGRIDGHTNALNNVYWTSRKTTNTTSLDRNFEKGFTPRLYSLITSSEAITQVNFDIDEVIEKVPALSIKSINGTAFNAANAVSSVQKTATIELALTENKEEVAEIKVYHNAKLIKTIPGDGASSFKVDVSLNSSFGADNYISAFASGKSGIESAKAKAVIQYKGVSDQQPTMYLLTIGINEYKNPKYNLNYAQADADGLSKSFQTTSSSLFNEIVQYNIRNNKAVKANIITALEEIKGKALEQDLLVVYYAGHGMVTENQQGETDFYLALHGLTQLYGNPGLLSDNAISATEIKALTQNINAQKQVFLLDACQSGGALESAAKRGVEEEKAIAQLARNTGTFWITASGSTQFATEVEQLGHGVFTYTLLKGLTGDADVNKDGKLSVRELSMYLEEQVPILTEQLKGTAQYPSSYSFGNDFPIVLY